MKKIKKASNPNSQEMKFSLIVLVLMVFCFAMLIVATFTQLKIFVLRNGHFEIINYIPQIPTVLFIAGLLGKRYGIFSAILYIITGLFLVPVFALGGGLDYILNMNFGYILAFIPAIYFAAKIIENKHSFLTLLLGNFAGVFTIHAIGVSYLTLVLLITKEPIQTILNWISNQSLNYLLVDLVFGFAAISLGCLIKLTLKKIA